MYKELYQYFLLHRELQLPGIGTFLLERQPAEIDIANREIVAPVYTVALHHGNASSSRRLYQWIASVYSIGESDAVVRFNDFVFETKNNILSGKRLEWSGFGILSKGLAGEIRFEPSVLRSFAGNLPATKVLRGNAGHVVRVGEQERSSGAIVNVYQSEEQAPKANKSWILIVLLIIAAIVFIGYYFSVNGVAPASAGSRSTVQPSIPSGNSRNIP